HDALPISLLSACQLMPKQQAAAVPITVVTGQPLPEWQSPRERDNPRVGYIIDLRSGATIALSQLLTELAEAPLVLLGEKHDNADHHALQLWLLQALEARRTQGSVVMDMLAVTRQEAINQVQSQLRDGSMPEELAAAT